MAVQFALPAAVSYGVADFAGGLATRRTSSTLVVIAVSQLAGAAALLPALMLLPGRPSAAAADIGTLAGLAGSTGLVLYFRGLARGPMGVMAPLSALTSAGLPLLVGVMAGESAGPLTAVGIVVALLAVALATREPLRTGRRLAGRCWRSGLVWALACSLSRWTRARRIPGCGRCWPPRRRLWWSLAR